MFKVSQSKINTARRCMKAYQYKYIEKLKKKAKARPLQFGTLVHEMVEAHAEGKDPFKKLAEISKINQKLFREEVEMYGEIVQDVTYIMTAYFDYWEGQPKSTLVYLPHNKKKAEHSFEVMIDKDILATGKIDAVAKSRKMNWLVEHKSHKTFPGLDERWRNMQSAVYVRFIEMLGWWDVEGTVWDYIRSKPPTRPQLLKAGTLSTKALDSLPQVVRDVLKANKLKEKDYAELIDSQEANVSTWFQRVYTPTKKPVVDSLFQDFVVSAKQLRDTNFDKPVPRSIGKHCGWCDFEAVCRAELQGSDSEYVKEREYAVRKNEVEETREEAARD